MILVLDAPRSAERRNREARDVTGREHVVSSAGPPVLVDEDAVVDLEAGGFGEVRRGDDSEPGDDHIRLDRRAVLRRHGPGADLLDELSRENGDALLAVVVVDERRELCGEETCADPVVREDDGHVASVRRERGGDLGADEPAADHGDADSVAGEARAAAGSRRASGSRRRRRRRPTAGVAACHRSRAGPSRTSASSPVSSVAVARIEVERDDASAGVDLDAELGRPAEHGALLLAAPQRLRQRRAGVRARVLRREHPDRARPRRDRGFRDTRHRPSSRRRRSGSDTPPSAAIVTDVGRARAVESRAALTRTATTGARRCGDRRGLRRASRRPAPHEQSRRRARRDLLLPVVLDTRRRTGAGRTGTSSTTARRCCRPRTSRAAASTRRRTPRSSSAQMREIAERRRRHDRRLVVGVRLAGERPAAAGRAGGGRSDGLDVAIHVEPYRGRTPAKAAEDIARLTQEHGFTDFYVYDADRDPAAEWAEALAPLDDVRVFGHTPLRRTREGVRVRRALHVRRGHVERRALPAAVHAGARGGPALRTFRRPGVRRPARDAPRVGASAERRADVRPDVEDGAEGRVRTSSR